MTAKTYLHALALSSCLLAAPAFAQDVNLYTTREPALLNPVLEAFTKDTGVKVNAVFLKDGLQERIRAEGANSPADVMLMVDVGEINAAVEAGITQPIKSDLVDKTVPAQLRPDNNWVTLTKRARVVVVSKDRIKQDAITYEDLADPKWKGKFCIRAGQHPYNNALFAAYLAHHGAEKTEAYLKALRANAARKPGGGDRDVARDIQSGLCDIAIINTYYIGLMSEAKNEQKGWFDAIKPLKTTFANAGTHVNVSAAALAKNAPNKANAVKLVEYMLGDKAQALYANGNFEFPVNTAVADSAAVKLLGAVTPDKLPLSEVAKQRKAAANLVDKVGFDN
ncbi:MULTISPECIES: extracellular solute-binding protein [Bosea]|uniref:extracellular solute-binding protein n=1 Tax=Bosea TaxID=85413 RepID=UPI00214FB6FA|nr:MULTISPECIES: extracellular solute-binding protein [Bosea]MCR4524601.1 extracellular solute-binding protein [Bosea sp. 47.2.35]MDR6830104.1 iron(III) transport system substrate-binding protein [Bosea robiniae]MDR6896935.1 iron(III) transport system substrate-binding protein [Bosea sp. BE109]MDR7140384.1 iron(III) transport system substrate-binding protein [Bosea sp. BE168]MDR7177029.1 iron(III) transport system substrate-binding protein [Bosea sp. BE271]